RHALQCVPTGICLRIEILNIYAKRDYKTENLQHIANTHQVEYVCILLNSVFRQNFVACILYQKRTRLDEYVIVLSHSVGRLNRIVSVLFHSDTLLNQTFSILFPNEHELYCLGHRLFRNGSLLNPAVHTLLKAIPIHYLYATLLIANGAIVVAHCNARLLLEYILQRRSKTFLIYIWLQFIIEEFYILTGTM
ncbi:MAG: hypothetical protein KAS29_14585, partial [Bacteroidales bacterium]|nr:hypothetical protein [Bacteroidales bacterium]